VRPSTPLPLRRPCATLSTQLTLNSIRAPAALQGAARERGDYEDVPCAVCGAVTSGPADLVCGGSVCRKQPNNARVCCRSCLVRHEKRAAEPTEAELEEEPEWLCTRCFNFKKDFAARMKAAKDAKKRAATSDAARGGAAAGAPPPPPPSSRLPATTPPPPAVLTVQKPSGAAAAKPGPAGGAGGRAAPEPGARGLTAGRIQELNALTSAFTSPGSEFSITLAFSSPLTAQRGVIRLRSVLGEAGSMNATTAAAHAMSLIHESDVFKHRAEDRRDFVNEIHRVAAASDLAKQEAAEERRLAELERELTATRAKLSEIQRRRSALLEEDASDEEEEEGAGGGEDDEGEDDTPPHIRSKHVLKRGNGEGGTKKRGRDE
jgi:hypothetical protein